MYFTKEDVEAGLMTKLINYLCDYSYASGPREFSHYNDIHIKPEDCNAFIVEWEQTPWSHDYGGKFEYVDEDQEVCYDLDLPDGSSVYTPDKEDYLKWWLDDNPGWEKDEYGRWHNRKEEPIFYRSNLFDGKPIDGPIDGLSTDGCVEPYKFSVGDD